VTQTPFQRYNNNKYFFLTKEQICKNVHKAISEFGFFIIIDHSITKETITTAFNHSKKFFSFSNEEKNQSTWKDTSSNRGYIPMNKESKNQQNSILKR
jgi:isopenicillin N synthase-like dioxygenase